MTDDAVQGRAPGASTTPPPCRPARSAATPPGNTSDGPREISHLVKSCKTWFCQGEPCWRQLIWPGDDYVRTVFLPGHDIVSVDKPVVWRFCTSCATRYGRPLPPRAPVQVLEEDSDAEPRYTLEEARQLLAPAMIPPPATEPPPPPPLAASFVGSFAAGPPAQLQIFDGHRWVGVREMVSAIDAQEAATGLVPGMELVRGFLRRMAGEAQ